MFAPSPPKTSGWYIITGYQEDGLYVNLLRSTNPITWDEPKNIALYYDYRLKNILVKLNKSSRFRYLHYYRELYGNYLCRSWNDQHLLGNKLSLVTITYMSKEILLPGEVLPKPRKTILVNYSCTKGFNESTRD